MRTLLKLVLVAALAYAFWKKGLPFIQSYGFTVPGAPGEINTEGWGCVRQVEDVHERLGEMFRQAKPNEQLPFLGKLREEKEEADILCRCEKRGCAEGREALELIASAVSQLANPTRIAEATMKGAATLEEIDEVLLRANAAARAATGP